MMIDSIDCVFIGGLTNGKIVVEHLRRNDHLSLNLVLTHPKSVDRPRSVNFSDEFETLDQEKVIHIDSFSSYRTRIEEIKPDLIFVAGCSEMLPPEIINLPPMGTIGFHPSKLPQDRGRSVLAWQIEEGYEETALSMFYLEEEADTGDIIAQEPITIENDDYIEDILKKVDEATDSLMEKHLSALIAGEAPRIPQDPDEGTYRELRGEKNSKINWQSSTEDIYNKIRAISKPYPGAYALYQGQKIRIWRANPRTDDPRGTDDTIEPGRILEEKANGGYLVKTLDGVLIVFPEAGVDEGLKFQS